MGGINRPVQVIRVLVPYRDFPHEEGFVELAHGQQEILIPTAQSPTRVWLCFEEREGVQCCLGDVDMFTTYNVNEGFILLARVNSEKAYVKWIAEFA